MKSYFCTAAMLVGILINPQLNTTSVPVEDEPFHKVVFKNDAITILHVVIPPGATTQYHTHSHDRIAVALSATSTTNQKMNEPESAASPTKPGDISALTLTDASYTHRVHNVGKVPYEVLDLEPTVRPATPSSDIAGTVAAETPSARVYNWPLAPGATTPVHTHSRPYVIISISAFNLKMSSPDGQSAGHPVSAGDFHFVDVKITHTLSNPGTTPGQIVEVELK